MYRFLSLVMEHGSIVLKTKKNKVTTSESRRESELCENQPRVALAIHKLSVLIGLIGGHLR